MEHPMKAMIVAAAAALSLTVGAAYAQGVPAGGDFQAPVYGSQAFSDHRNEPVVHFLGQGTVFAKIFGHSNSDQAAADRTAELKATSAKGG
jgi:hypothetical protein